MDSDHLGLELSVFFQFKIVNLLADDLGYPGKWVKLVNFEAENEYFCTWEDLKLPMVQPEETLDCVAEVNNTTGRIEVNRIFKLRIGEQSGALASLVRGLFAWP